jgi:hypothetical protein
VKRYARRRDACEAEIVDTLRAYGAAVERLDGAGLPDLLVSWHDELYLLECKDHDGGVSTRAPHRGKGNALEGPLAALTPAQREWWAHWRGRLPVIVTSAYEALRAIGVKL